MGLDQEVEGSVIDVVGDWSTEGFRGLTAEHNVKACFLTWWDHLGEGTTLLELLVLVYKDSNIDVLSKVIGDNEAFGS